MSMVCALKYIFFLNTRTYNDKSNDSNGLQTNDGDILIDCFVLPRKKKIR